MGIIGTMGIKAIIGIMGIMGKKGIKKIIEIMGIKGIIGGQPDFFRCRFLEFQAGDRKNWHKSEKIGKN